MVLVQFTRNNQDHFNIQGFQFEYCCDKCGNGYNLRFRTEKGLGKLPNPLIYLERETGFED